MRTVTLIIALLAHVAAANAAPLADVVRDRAAGELPDELGLLEVLVPSSMAELDLEPSQVSLEWRGAPRAGNVSLLVSVREDDDERRGWVRLRIGERAPVLVAARDLSEGGAIGDGDLRLERRTVEHDEGWRLLPGSIAGAAVLCDVSAGTIITADEVAEPAPVARGTEINVLIRRGRLTVSTVGTLERQARPGSLVRIRLTTHRRVIRARLIDGDTAVLGGDDR